VREVVSRWRDRRLDPPDVEVETRSGDTLLVVYIGRA
jgi:hypothetical protein